MLTNCVKVKCTSFTTNNQQFVSSHYSSQVSHYQNAVTGSSCLRFIIIYPLLIVTLAVHGISTVTSMKKMMQNLKLNEINLYNNQLSKLETDLYNLINTSKYDLSTSWPTGDLLSNLVLIWHKVLIVL